MANTINSTNNLTSTKIPQLYIRYFNPKIKANETISIRYYVSDSTQAEYLNKDDSKTFTTIVKIKDKSYTKTTKAGEYSIDIGSIATTGETYFSIQTIDDNGVASIEQFFDILIVNDSYNQVNNYNMTTADLSTYNITVGATASIAQAKANNTGLNKLFKAVRNNGHNKITMLNKVYMLDYHSDKVVLPDHFTVDMNGATFKATQCNDINVSNLVDLKDCFDSHVKNGKLIGNYDGFDFEATKTNTNYNIPGEGLAVAEINGAKYSSFENMEMGYSVGYNLGVFGGKLAGYVGTPGKLAFPNAYYINNQGGTVSSTTMSTTELIDISTLLDRGEIQCNVYLGYGGLSLNKAELFFHFYDSQSAYKTTIKSRQYQIVKIPSGTKYLRITGFTPTTTSSGMTICHTGGATNCELINIKSHNTRTCAMHPGIYNHLLIKNCSFNYVADENEYKVTKLALDFEDGYENGKNLFFINNEVYNGTSALTIQRAFNSNVINCRNFGLDIRGHIKGGLFKNNFFNDGSIYTTSFESQSHIKLHNNTFLKVLKFLKWDDKGDYSTIGLTKLDCKQSYQNNSNINVIIDKAVESSGSGGEITPETLTISTISNITQPQQTEFYIDYSTNIAVVKHEISWDGGNMFYDKTSDVEASGTRYRFKHDNKGNAGTYQMAIRVTTAKGTTKTSNVFTVTLTSASTPEPTLIYDLGSEKTFDGTSKYIDTMVKPFKTASDYTIFLDFDDGGTTQNDNLANVMHCVYEAGDYDGLKIYLNKEDGHYYLVGNSENTTTNYTYEDSWTMVKGQRNKIAIAISKGVVSNIVINGSTVAVNRNEYDMNDYSLILGAYQDAETNKSKYWKGTIHACKIWNSAFTVAEMKELFDSSSNPGGGTGDAYRPGRTLIWEDDFTGTSLNTSNWDYENNYSRPNEVQNYVAGTNNVWVENSNLVIKAKKESSNGKEWSSGCIHTDNKREFMYGRFEAKIKIPQTIGSFPAFWTLGGNYEEGNGITWPYCGEIDIMEHKQGYAWTTAGALYRTDLVWDNWDAKDLGRVDSGNIGSFDDYHIYAMEWTANKLDYYVDDRLIGHSDISDDSQWFMFHQPHYILLNQALGAAGGSVPSNMTEYTMYVDWVRVYAPEEAPSGGETTNRIWFEDTSARHMDKWSKLGLIPKFNESWTNKVITWKSSDESVATVCGGRVDSKGVDGSCIITATTLEGNSASITVTVGNAQPPTPTTTIGNMTYGKGINQSTHVITDNAECWATIDSVTVEQGATYTLQMDATWVWGCAYDDDDKFVKELFTSTGNNNYKYTFTAPTSKIRYGCYDPSKYLTYCNLTKTSGTVALTISNIGNITQTEQTEFYIEYSTNKAVTKHEVSWDGGSTFYDKTSDVTSSGNNYKFKHDSSGNAGTYRMAIRVTTSSGETKTSNVFTVTLESKPESGTIGNMTFGKKVDTTTHKIVDSSSDWATVNAVTVEKGAHYSLQMDATWVWCYAYNDNDEFVKELFTTTGNYNTKYTFVAETSKIRYGCYDPRKYLSYCNLTKTSGGSSGGNTGGGGDSSNTEYATSCTSAYILDKMYPMPQPHEALPSGVKDTWATQSRWENQQRPTALAHNCGQANCPGAVAFRALGAWANVYRVKDKGFSANTGVEMRNIKVYGWYNGQWEKVQDLAVPNGNFYAESFSGDSNTYFSDSIKTTSTSKTIILREANKVNGENCMYHPFSDIKNFDTKYQYVYTCIDLRKVKWNESGTDDRDSSHYCASCGGDWWLAEGLTFDSSWQHNKGVAQPKIIEITKEWRRFSMTTVPQNWTNGFPQ